MAGASKGKFKFFIPPSAEDFVGLIYPLLSKGKLGDAQMAWFDKHLLKPYARAMSNMSTARLNLMEDFKALKKELDVPAELKKEAVDNFKGSDQSFDCVLLDLSMPKLDGREVVQQIRAINKNIPIIIMSGYDDAETYEQFSELNLFAALQKPAPTKKILETIYNATKQ